MPFRMILPVSTSNRL